MNESFTWDDHCLENHQNDLTCQPSGKSHPWLFGGAEGNMDHPPSVNIRRVFELRLLQLMAEWSQSQGAGEGSWAL